MSNTCQGINKKRKELCGRKAANKVNGKSYCGHHLPITQPNEPDLDEIEKLPGETWKINPDYPGYYISNMGRIIMKNGKLSESDYVNENGYFRISIVHKNIDKSEKVLVHQLVAQTFLEKVPGKNFVFHKNSIKTDNRVENLGFIDNENKEYVEYKETRPKKEKEGNVIQQFELDATFVKLWPTEISIKKEYKVSSKELKKACIDGYEMKGYLWRYLSDAGNEEYESNDDIDENDEIWNEVIYKDKKYTVSNLGRIIKQNGIITKGSPSSGYLYFDNIGVHRLVCLAFHPIENYEKLYVNHKNLDRLHNDEKNLEWVTNSENINHEVESTGRYRRAQQLDLQDPTKVIKTYVTIHTAATKFGFGNETHLRKICKRQGVFEGYRWKYEDEKLNPTDSNGKFKKIVKLDPKNPLIILETFNRVQQVIDKYDIGDKNYIRKVCREQKEFQGFKWRYEQDSLFDIVDVKIKISKYKPKLTIKNGIVLFNINIKI